jgi:hypothetical protein
MYCQSPAPYPDRFPETVRFLLSKYFLLRISGGNTSCLRFLDILEQVRSLFKGNPPTQVNSSLARDKGTVRLIPVLESFDKETMQLVVISNQVKKGHPVSSRLLITVIKGQ